MLFLSDDSFLLLRLLFHPLRLDLISFWEVLKKLDYPALHSKLKSASQLLLSFRSSFAPSRPVAQIFFSVLISCENFCSFPALFPWRLSENLKEVSRAGRKQQRRKRNTEEGEQSLRKGDEQGRGGKHEEEEGRTRVKEKKN